eukprot:c21838_g2_i1 orf=2075-2479(+)
MRVLISGNLTSPNSLSVKPPVEVSMFLRVLETSAADLSITNSKPSALMSFTVSSFLIPIHTVHEMHYNPSVHTRKQHTHHTHTQNQRRSTKHTLCVSAARQHYNDTGLTVSTTHRSLHTVRVWVQNVDATICRG